MHKIGIIGAGRVGVSMACYLRSCGCDITGFYSRTAQSAQLGCRQAGGRVYASPGQLAADCGTVLIATPDDAIAPAAAALAEAAPIWAGRTVLHFSGACSSQLLTPLRQRGASVFSLHPIYTFSGPDTTPDELARIWYTAEGEGDARFITDNFSRVSWIAPEDKPLYHAGLCMMSNYMVTLMDEAFTALCGTGLDAACFAPLAQRTLANIFEKGTAAALTGPISRGDAGTLRRHMDALGPQRGFYRDMGTYTAALAHRAGRLDDIQLANVMEGLTDGKNNDE